jgi:hypothetical protein
MRYGTAAPTARTAYARHAGSTAYRTRLGVRDPRRTRRYCTCIRAILYLDAKVRILSRNDRDVTGSFPVEIAARAAALGIGPVILDGEIVALDQNGAPSFSLLANRMHVRSPTSGLLRAVLSACSPLTCYT